MGLAKGTTSLGNSTSQSKALAKAIRDMFGIKYPEDINLDNDMEFAVFITELKNNLFFYLSFTKQYTLLRELFWGEGKDVYPILERAFNVATQQIQISNKTPLTAFADSNAYLTLPIDLSKYDHLPPFERYGCLYLEYKRVNFMYQDAKAAVYQVGMNQQVAVINNLVQASKNYPEHVKSELHDLYREIIAYADQVRTEYLKPCLTADGHPDFDAMEEKLDYLKDRYTDTTNKLRNIVTKYENVIEQKIKDGLHQVEQVVEQSLEVVKAQFEPELKALREKLVELNKEIVSEVEVDLDNFINILDCVAVNISDQNIKNKLLDSLNELGKLQKELNVDSYDFEALQDVLKKCYESVQDLSPLFAEGQPLSPFINQNKSIMDSLSFKANFQPPNTMDEFNLKKHGISPKYIRIQENDVIRLFQPLAPKFSVSFPPNEQSILSQGQNTDAQVHVHNPEDQPPSYYDEPAQAQPMPSAPLAEQGDIISLAEASSVSENLIDDPFRGASAPPAIEDLVSHPRQGNDAQVLQNQDNQMSKPNHNPAVSQGPDPVIPAQTNQANESAAELVAKSEAGQPSVEHRNNDVNHTVNGNIDKQRLLKSQMQVIAVQNSPKSEIPWDLFDAGAKLLSRKDNSPETREQIEAVKKIKIAFENEEFTEEIKTELLTILKPLSVKNPKIQNCYEKVEKISIDGALGIQLR